MDVNADITPNVLSWVMTALLLFSGSVLGYLFAMRKFRKEYLWQEKYKTYQNILSALEAMILWSSETYSYNMAIPCIGKDALKKDITMSFVEARRIIAKATCIGKLLIPTEVIAELEKLEQSLWDEDFRAEDDVDYYPNTQEEAFAYADHAANIGKLIKPRLEKIICFAREDLGL